MAIASGFPNVSLPIADPKTGLINQTWLQFLISLWNRTGQSSAGPITAVTAGPNVVVNLTGSSAEIELGLVAAGDLLANVDAITAAPTGVSLSTFLDAVVGADQGSLLVRGYTFWQQLLPGTLGQLLQAGGPDTDLAWADPAPFGSGSATAVAGAATLDQGSGVITSEALAAATTYTLTLTNSLILTTSTVLVNATDSDGLLVTLVSVTPAAGSVVIAVSMAALTGTVVISFAVFN